MSEILSNIVLQPINSTFVPETNSLNVTPEAIQLNIFTAGSAGAGQSSNGELLFNNLNNIDGVPNTSVSGGNLRFTNIANLKINGGVNSYFLQTDGTGNLTWAVYPGNISGNSAPGGANTQIQFNDGGANFGGSAGFTFDKVSNAVYMPGDLFVTGTINGNISANFNANYANFAGNAFSVTGSNVVGAVGFANIANTANAVAGANVSGQVANALIAGTVYTNAQPNITSLGTLTSLTTGNINVTKIANIVVGLENVNLIPAQTGTYNFDILTSPIQYATANATANLTLNVRGNSTTAFSSLIANGQSITVSYALTTGATPYGITSLEIDGSSVTPKYAGSTIFVSNAVTAFTYTIIKNSSTYTVLGSVTRYL